MAWLQEGEWIRETLEVERLLGEGAFAEVYRIRDRLLRRRLALKLFKTPFRSFDLLETTLQEARVLSALEHRNIVSIHDAGILERKGQRLGYFTMDYVAGGDLDAYWRGYGRALVPVGETVEILRQIAEAVALAHEQQPAIVHRDIKPHNILLGMDKNGLRAVLGDFGLAKSVNPMTLLASARGTLEFKAPEAFEGLDTTAGDVWSLGVTGYLLLTDRVPYPKLAERGMGDARKLMGPLTPASVYNIHVDPVLDGILTRCLEPERSARYADARALARDLAAWVPGDPKAAVTSGQSTFPTERSKSARGHAANDLEVMIREAFNLAKSSGRLETAADILEQAILCKPELREKYQSRLKQWRQGVWM